MKVSLKYLFLKAKFLKSLKLQFMLIIGIAGGTGSGKTTVVRKIIENFPKNEVAVLSQDSYYKDNSHLPLEERQEINFDHPNSIEFDLLVEHLKQLKKGNPIEEPIYSYITCTRSKDTNKIEPKKVVIVEGILVFTHKALREMFDIKVFVFADADDRLIRVINRDTIERGRDVRTVIERYHKSVKPMHRQFIEPSKSYADLIIPEGGQNRVAIEIVTSMLEKTLAKED